MIGYRFLMERTDGPHIETVSFATLDELKAAYDARVASESAEPEAPPEPPVPEEVANVEPVEEKKDEQPADVPAEVNPEAQV